MAWNEPGGKRREPWQSGGGNEPDLEGMLRRLRERFGNFGSGGGGGVIIVVALALISLWFVLDSARIIDASERGVVLRFGKFDREMGAGLNFKWPAPIERVEIVEATRVRSTSDQVRMLTKDENLVILDFNVQYVVGSAREFLFQVREPEKTLQQAAESAVREVIGANEMDVILSGERTVLATRAREILQKTLDSYATGVMVTEFNFQNVRPPQEVKEAFDDAITAREDRQRFENVAEAYRSKVEPEARGEAARIRAEAEGDKAAVVAIATGEARRFELLAEQYRAAPQVTRKRLLLETMQEVLSRSSKIVVEGGGEKIINLPSMPGFGAGAADTRLPTVVSEPSVNASTPAVVSATSRRDDDRKPTGDREERNQ
jgi:membrane protease subunit HflK